MGRGRTRERSPGKLSRREGSDDTVRRWIKAIDVRNVSGNFPREELADILVEVRSVDHHRCGIRGCLSRTKTRNAKKPHRAESNDSHNRRFLSAHGGLRFKSVEQGRPNSFHGSPVAKKRADSWVFRSNNVILAARSKNIYNERVFQSTGAVFDSAADRETVTGSNVERFSLARDFQMSANDVDNLVVRVAVDTACPASGHLVLGEKEFVVVGHHLPRQTRFRLRLFRRFLFHDDQTGKHLPLGAHLNPPIYSTHRANHPPSTTKTWPWTQSLAGEQRNTAAPARSSGSPQRPAGIRSITRRFRTGSLPRSAVLSVATSQR